MQDYIYGKASDTRLLIKQLALNQIINDTN